MKLLTNIWNAIIGFFKRLFGIKKKEESLPSVDSGVTESPNTSTDEPELEDVVEGVDDPNEDSTEDTEMVESPNEEESTPKGDDTIEDEDGKDIEENAPNVEDDGCPNYVITHKKISDNKYQFYVNIE